MTAILNTPGGNLALEDQHISPLKLAFFQHTKLELTCIKQLYLSEASGTTSVSTNYTNLAETLASLLVSELLVLARLW